MDEHIFNATPARAANVELRDPLLEPAADAARGENGAAQAPYLDPRRMVAQVRIGHALAIHMGKAGAQDGGMVGHRRARRLTGDGESAQSRQDKKGQGVAGRFARGRFGAGFGDAATAASSNPSRKRRAPSATAA